MGRPKEPISEKVDFEQLYMLATHGFIDEELAEFYKVDRRTITNWKADPEFLSHLKKGKELADGEVVRSLYRKACGYQYTCEKSDKKGGTYTMTVDVPPDTVACIFWLKNRQKKEWRDKIEQHHTGNEVGTRIVIIRADQKESDNGNGERKGRRISIDPEAG